MLALWACAGPALAADPERDSFEADEGVTAEVPADVSEARDDLREDLGDQGLLNVDESSGAVRFLAKLDGYLDSAPSDHPADAARDYLMDQADAFGVERSDIADLRLTDRETAGGIQSLEFTQSVDGVPIVDSSLQAHLDDDGRLLAITGGLVPDAELNTAEPKVSRDDALAAATAGVASPDAAHEASLVGYASGDELRLAWRVPVAASSTAYYDTLVDASTGEVVRRANLVRFASASVFDNYPGADDASPTSLDGYVTPGADRLIGPNAHAYVDPDEEISAPNSALDFPDPNPADETPASSAPDNFEYPFDQWVPDPGDDYSANCTSAAFLCSWNPKNAFDWAADSDQAATQLFWYVNVFHDHLKVAPGIGFNDPSNFEGDDPVIAQAQDGANTNTTLHVPDSEHSNNANMLVLPEGHSPLMQMYLWDPVNDSDPVRDFRPVHGGDDPSLVFHEYTHGLIHRLVTDAQGFGALNGPQAGAIDEGTADWYALDFLVEQGQIPDDEDAPGVTLATYEVVGPTGLRTQAIDCQVGPASSFCPDAGGGAGGGGYTYGDFGKVAGGAEVHADGEIWAQTLWQLRERLTQTHGESDGLMRVRRLVTEGLRLVPPNPSFLDMRNAMLLADVQANGGDRDLIWSVFSSRGMGYAASTRGTDDVTPVPDYTPPALYLAQGSMVGVVRDQNSGAPLANALVAFAGHDSGLGEDLSALTHADGSYRIDGVPARTWDFVTVAPAAGYDRAATEDVTITANKVLARNFSLRRNWALASGGAQVRSFTGPNFDGLGCGPGSAIDGTRRGVWSTRSPTNPAGPGTKEVVITLPQAITLGEVRIDPSSGCGDPSAAALGGFQLQVSANASSYTTVSQGTFTAASLGKASTVGLSSKPSGVRYVRLRALSTQGTSSFMDVAELQVFALAATTAPPPPTPTPPTPPDETVTLKLLTKRAKLTRRRGFVFKVSGPRGASAKALFTVKVRRGSRLRKITLARASFRISTSTGRARVVVRVSRRTLRRIRARKLRVAVTVRAAGQRKSSSFSLRRPKASRRR